MFWGVSNNELSIVFFVKVVIPGSFPVILIIWHEMAVRLDYQVF